MNTSSQSQSRRGKVVLLFSLLYVVMFFAFCAYWVWVFGQWTFVKWEFSGFLMLCALLLLVLTPILGVTLCVYCLRKLEKGKRAAFSLAALGTILLTFIAWSMVTVSNADIASPKDVIINQLNNIAADVYAYRMRPSSQFGGNGSYLGYKLPDSLKEDKVATYLVKALSRDSIAFEGKTKASEGGIWRSGSVLATVFADGKLGHWDYKGDFR